MFCYTDWSWRCGSVADISHWLHLISYRALVDHRRLRHQMEVCNKHTNIVGLNIVLSCTFLSFLTLNNVVTLISGLQVTQNHSNWYRFRKLGCGFLFACHSNYGSILHHFRDKARYWSKIVIFPIPLLSTPPLGNPPQNIAIRFGMEKLYRVRCLFIIFGTNHPV